MPWTRRSLCRTGTSQTFRQGLRQGGLPRARRAAHEDDEGRAARHHGVSCPRSPVPCAASRTTTPATAMPRAGPAVRPCGPAGTPPRPRRRRRRRRRRGGRCSAPGRAPRGSSAQSLTAGTSSASAAARRVRRKASPSTSAGDQARARLASVRQRRARRAHRRRCAVATATGSRTRPPSRRARMATEAASVAQLQDRPTGQCQQPHRQRPCGHVQRRHGIPVAERERPGGRSRRRPGAPASAPSDVGPVVLDGAGRHVAHVPSGLAQAPHQVDVLAAAQARVEEVGAGDHVGADEEGRARHVRDRAGRPHQSRVGPAVERRPHRLVPGERVGRSRRRGVDDARAPPRPPAGRRSGRAAARATPPTARSRSPRRRRSGCPPRPDRRCGHPTAPRWSPARRSGRRGARRSPWWPPRRPTRRRRRCTPGPEHAEQPLSWAGRSRTGTTTVTSSTPAPAFPGRGTKAPADTRRRASIRAAAPGPTGAPDLQRSTRSRARDEIRKRRSGLPPSSTVPLVERHRRRILGQHEPGRERRRCAGGALRSSEGAARGAGVGHRPILAARGRR